MKGIVGREAEIRELQERYSSDRAQFVAVMGLFVGANLLKIFQRVWKSGKKIDFSTLFGVFSMYLSL